MRISERRKYAHDLFLPPSFSISMSMPPSFLPSLPPPSPPDPPQSLGRGGGRGGSLLPSPPSAAVWAYYACGEGERARGGGVGGFEIGGGEGR